MSRFDTDIIERLRWDKRYTNGHVPVTLEDAAVEIERLRSAISWMENLDPPLVEAARARFAKDMFAAAAETKRAAATPESHGG